MLNTHKCGDAGAGGCHSGTGQAGLILVTMPPAGAVSATDMTNNVKYIACFGNSLQQFQPPTGDFINYFCTQNPTAPKASSDHVPARVTVAFSQAECDAFVNWVASGGAGTNLPPCP